MQPLSIENLFTNTVLKINSQTLCFLLYSFSICRHENLKTVKGDAYKLESFVDEIAEKDAVMSCLGSNARGIGQTTTIYSETVKIIFEAMKR